MSNIPKVSHDISPKAYNIRLVIPSGQKYKETFDDGQHTTLAEVLNRVAERLSSEAPGRRWDLLYGYPPKPLSKRLKEFSVQSENKSRDDSTSEVNSRLKRNIRDLSLDNETVTVRYI